MPAAPGPQLADSAGWDGLQYSSTIQTADLDGNGTAEIVARDGDHLIAFTFTGTDLATGTWSVLPNGPAWSDAAGWTHRRSTARSTPATSTATAPTT